MVMVMFIVMVMLIVMLWLCLCYVYVYVYVYVNVMFMSCLRSCLLLWVRALALRSGDPEFKTRSDHWMYLAN